jgi:hypothetical protein
MCTFVDENGGANEEPGCIWNATIHFVRPLDVVSVSARLARQVIRARSTTATLDTFALAHGAAAAARQYEHTESSTTPRHGLSLAGGSVSYESHCGIIKRSTQLRSDSSDNEHLRTHSPHKVVAHSSSSSSTITAAAAAAAAAATKNSIQSSTRYSLAA